jgi:formate hydrogenlyase transcriptional activator
MSTSAIFKTESDPSIAERYEYLIRIAASVRAQKEPQELFGILVHELGQVLQFDAIAQFDERSNKVDWHLCSGCRRPHSVPSELDNENTLAAWVFRHQEPIALSSLNGETRFPASIEIMRQTGLQSVCAFPLTTAHRRLGDCQRLSQCLLPGRGSVLRISRQPDRIGDG